MRNYIDKCNKESEKYAAYPEQSTIHFENVVNITVDSDCVITQEKQDRSEEYFQEDRKIPYDKNEANNSIKRSE